MPELRWKQKSRLKPAQRLIEEMEPGSPGFSFET